jgi:hypothetical protein
MYSWAKKYVSTGTNRVSLEQLRKVLGLESVRDAEGNIIQEALYLFGQTCVRRALDTAIVEVTKKTDISIQIESLERSKHRRVTSVRFVIKEQAVPNR